MPSEAQKKANRKYHEKQDMISIRVPKGEPDKFKEFAESQGESLTAFIRRAIIESIEKENGNNFTFSEEEEECWEEHAEAQGESLKEFIKRAIIETIERDQEKRSNS